MYIEKDTVLKAAKDVHDEIETYEFRNQLSLITDKEHLTDLCKKLKHDEETSFDMLIDITAIDWLEKKEDRFEVVYFLFSNKHKHRLTLKVPISEDDPVCPSVTDVWQSADWYERETWDMYGVKFKGHPHPRRFYMTEDYKDPETGEPLHPMRKDYPLLGIEGASPLPPYPEKYGEPEDNKPNENGQEK